jgi:hypothetical protein
MTPTHLINAGWVTICIPLFITVKTILIATTFGLALSLSLLLDLCAATQSKHWLDL